MSERKCVLSQCCCGCTLKTGAWVTAILCLISAVINAATSINDALNRHNNSSWGTLVVNILMLIIAIVLLVGVRNSSPKLIWVWVYTQLVITVLGIILFLVAGISSGDIIGMIIGLVLFSIVLYFILVVRSYAFELEGVGGGNVV